MKYQAIFLFKVLCGIRKIGEKSTRPDREHQLLNIISGFLPLSLALYENSVGNHNDGLMGMCLLSFLLQLIENGSYYHHHQFCHCCCVCCASSLRFHLKDSFHIPMITILYVICMITHISYSSNIFNIIIYYFVACPLS